ncbi:MAG: C40 family peptidase [Treponema sp.]|nr:C40 family peptidase [Treponema sp.]
MNSRRTPNMKIVNRVKIATIAFLAALAVFIPVNCFCQGRQGTVAVSPERQQLIDFALTLRGTPYRYAGKTPDGFDCSGFVSYALNYGANVILPPSSKGIYASARVQKIEATDREPGDLVFFKTTSSPDISHVGIYLGRYEGKDEKGKAASISGIGKLEGRRLFIHAASDGPDTGVIVSSIDDGYWAEHLTGYGRVLAESAANPAQ